MNTILWFSEITKDNVREAGGKGANLGEMANAGFPVPPGFVVSSSDYFSFLGKTGIREKIASILKNLDVEDNKALNEASWRIKETILTAKMPTEIAGAIVTAYERLARGKKIYVAVRSSATAEDLPAASFAGQQVTFLNVTGAEHVVNTVQAVWSSLFEARAIFYRATHGFDHFKVGIAVPIQIMVQSEKSGVMFTLDTVTNDEAKIEIEAGLGLGETVVSGAITPDRYLVDKKTLDMIDVKVAKQTWKIAMVDEKNRHVDVPPVEGEARKLSEREIKELAELGRQVEEHYRFPQDIEWAIAGGKIYLVQTRPVTTLKKAVREEKPAAPAPEGKVLLEGVAASFGVASGPVRVILSADEIDKVKQGDVLVTTMTSPDYVPAMRRAAAIVTDTGGRTAHAAIVSRELGIPCAVGTGSATKTLSDGQLITVDGSKGLVMSGEVKVPAAEAIERKMAPPAPAEVVPVTATKIYVNLGEPELAEEVAARPVDGVGLLRAEFMIAGIGEHPRAMMEDGRSDEFVDKLAAGLKTFAQAFFPRPVVYRATDFKTNEYRNLKGGDKYEPVEGNPMIGYRGASRYVKEPDLFRLELAALKKVRKEWGLKNLHLMIPFVRTLDELSRIGQILDLEALRPTPDFKLWMMVEVPSNVFLIDEFCRSGIDGVSIGSNDLTQLILGIDRDSELLAAEFDERNPAVVMAIKTVIEKAEEHGVTSSLCGQAPSVYPEIAEMLVEFGITSISVNPDVIESVRKIVAAAEQKILLRRLERIEKLEKQLRKPPEVA
ncbi:MAG: phosphoenolpyruvate synthase [Actinobacteria bacterium]|nr:phosphoenolpyruvate synthase [Actinomycetota bacterium]